MVEQLAQVIPGVLLLTATPEQLGQDSHFARLRLLDPNRFHDLAAFRAESEHYRPVAEAVQELLDEGRLSPKAHATIEGFLGAEGEALLAAVTDGDSQASARLIRELLDRHGTGRVLFRNTRAAIQGFPERQLHPTHWPIRRNTTICRAANVPSSIRKWPSGPGRNQRRRALVALRSAGRLADRHPQDAQAHQSFGDLRPRRDRHGHGRRSARALRHSGHGVPRV